MVELKVGLFLLYSIVLLYYGKNSGNKLENSVGLSFLFEDNMVIRMPDKCLWKPLGASHHRVAAFGQDTVRFRTGNPEIFK